ncbi:MAG: hypothetical protein UF228_06895 [Lachnospiraceae bacterium]|nr:hypothetical protein [Lachnospiraceae bacterium]
MKMKKYIIGIAILTCLLALLGIGIYVYNEKAWEPDFATSSTGVSFAGENYIPQPPGSKLNEIQFPNQLIQCGDELYYKTGVITEFDTNKIYAYNTKTKETRFIYATKEEDERSLHRFSTNGRKLVLIYNEGEVSVVDLFTQIESSLKVQKFQEAAVYGHEFIYMMTDGSIWRQNLRSDKATKLEGVNAKSMTVYKGVVYYEDVDNGNCISKYNMDKGEIIKTDEVLETYFAIKDGELVQYKWEE